MPNIVASVIISLDGYDANASFEPTAEEHAYFNALFGASDSIILDVPNHELLVPYWDEIDLNDPGVNAVEREFARIFRSRRRHVVTTSGEGLEPLATPISGDLVQSISALREQPGQQILLAGDTDLLGFCLNHGLVDEVQVVVRPVVLGDGMAPFGDVQASHQLHLLELRPFASGAFVARYAVG